MPQLNQAWTAGFILDRPRIQGVSGQEKLGAKFQVVEVINLEFGRSDPQGRPDSKKTYAKFWTPKFLE